MKWVFLILIVIAVVIMIWGAGDQRIIMNGDNLTPTSASTTTISTTSSGTTQTIQQTPEETIDPEKFWATAYNIVYDSEIEGTQEVTKAISGSEFTLKASFLYGGFGVSMQGIGKTEPGGTCIQHLPSGGSFVRIGNSTEFTDTVRNEYKQLGITDFTGFGPLALSSPVTSEYFICTKVTGSSNRILKPWYSIATDPAYIPTGTKGIIIFRDGKTLPSGGSRMEFSADDTGGAIKGKRIDIFIGDGEAALNQWYTTGGNRYVEIIFQNGTQVS